MQVTSLGHKILQSDVLGSFDFQTMLISMESLSSDMLSLAAPLFVGGSSLNLEAYNGLDRVYPLAAHEGTHFVDATSTLWGLRHLGMLSAAHLGLSSREESKFYLAKQFYDHLRSIKLPDYYSIVVNRPVVRPWKYSPSVGRIFDHAGQINAGRPVFFCQFVDERDGLLARSPLSTVSILEASAMAQELFMRLQLLDRLPDAERRVEWRLRQRELVAHLYDHKLTEYSVCVHLAANQQDCQDVIAAFRVVALLTRICLNFPISKYRTLADNQELSELLAWNRGSEEASRLSQALRLHDMGALYYLLLRLLPANAYFETSTLMNGIHEVGSMLQMNWSEVRADSEEEADGLSRRLAESTIEKLRLVGASGLRNFRNIDGLGIELSFENIDLPKMYFCDDVSVHVLGHATGELSRVDPEEVFDALSPIARDVESFGKACV